MLSEFLYGILTPWGGCGWSGRGAQPAPQRCGHSGCSAGVKEHRELQRQAFQSLFPFSSRLCLCGADVPVTLDSNLPWDFFLLRILLPVRALFPCLFAYFCGYLLLRNDRSDPPFRFSP